MTVKLHTKSSSENKLFCAVDMDALSSSSFSSSSWNSNSYLEVGH